METLYTASRTFLRPQLTKVLSDLSDLMCTGKLSKKIGLTINVNDNNIELTFLANTLKDLIKISEFFIESDSY